MESRGDSDLGVGQVVLSFGVSDEFSHRCIVDAGNEVADVFVAAERRRGAEVGFAGGFPGVVVGVVLGTSEVGGPLVARVGDAASEATTAVATARETTISTTIRARMPTRTPFALTCSWGTPIPDEREAPPRHHCREAR